jgi:hypothetical protein
MGNVWQAEADWDSLQPIVDRPGLGKISLFGPLLCTETERSGSSPGSRSVFNATIFSSLIKSQVNLTSSDPVIRDENPTAYDNQIRSDIFRHIQII